jgi:UV DNA damage endonuclease
MRVRFGFVAMSVMLKDASPSKTVTQKTYLKLLEKDPQVALDKLQRTAEQNLDNCLRLLHHCLANHIKVYRFSSRIIPLATHPLLRDWPYLRELGPQLARLGEVIREHRMRVTFHPDHFTLLNSPREEVFLAAAADLAHHTRLFQAMGLGSTAKLIIHVGGAYQSKPEALERFVENWARLPRGIASRVTLENDDKTFTAGETLYLCEKLQLPMVLDLHHHRCNPGTGEELADIIPRFLQTWHGTGLPPKLHISSPKSVEDLRSHHDYIKTDDLYPALQMLKSYGQDVDIMVEAKMKDRAVFRLVGELSAKPGIEAVDGGSIRVS